MRLLVVNPNTSASITCLVANHVGRIAGPALAIRAATGRFGARYIASRTAYAVAGHAALDALAEHGAGCDAVLLACFGDPGLLALREAAGGVPVVGMAEASFAAGAKRGRFAVVTGGNRWEPMLRDFALLAGFADRLGPIRTVAPTGADIAADPDGSIALLAEACRAAAAEGADCVILGGAGLAGLAERVQPTVPVPVLCSLETAVAAVLAAMRSGGGAQPADPLGQMPPVETVGLSPALASMFGGAGPIRPSTK